MSKFLKAYCLNIGQYIEFCGGDSLADIARSLHDKLGFDPICAHVNNKTEDLSFPVFGPKQIEFLDAFSPSGKRVYIRSLCMMLYKALTIVCPEV